MKSSFKLNQRLIRPFRVAFCIKLIRVYSPSFQILVCRLQKLVQVCHRYNALDVMFSLTFKGYVPDITPREHTLCSATPLIHPILNPFRVGGWGFTRPFAFWIIPLPFNINFGSHLRYSNKLRIDRAYRVPTRGLLYSTLGAYN